MIYEDMDWTQKQDLDGRTAGWQAGFLNHIIYYIGVQQATQY